jgi:hypothetical protein
MAVLLRQKASLTFFKQRNKNLKFSYSLKQYKALADGSMKSKYRIIKLEFCPTVCWTFCVTSREK